ncbi:S41 family peptidase [Fulvivirga lutea]|uniref:Tail specific protease domain-containing protein n=1 Tax=Fulvivirga lutea TaxID=2810512 RepID=A0A974WHL4_9BACT|nr:S41 family peptidase [Fulvivirga lutea]QSE98044.1 hypothetical protein JR347_02885 [Fulvivirga lutea]
MKKAYWLTAAFFIISLLIILLKQSSPFGWIFSLALNLFFACVVAFLLFGGLHLWYKNKVLSRIFSSLILAFALLIGAIQLLINIDYRLVLPLTSTDMSQEDWQEDINFLQSKIVGHPAVKADVILPRKINYKNLEGLSDDDKLLEIIRQVSVFKDGHSYVPPFQLYNQSQYLPLKGYYFDDGYYVLAAASEYQELVGKQILKIGGVSIEHIFNQVIEITGPENEYNAKYRFDFYLYNLNLLKSLKVVDGDKVPIIYRDNEKENVVTVKGGSFINWLFWVLKPNELILPPTIGLQKPNYNLFFEDKNLVLRLNLIENISDDNSIEMLADQLRSQLKSEPESLIIDLRNNSGGNNQLYEPIIRAILESTYINDSSRLFIFTSYTTFSAGINFLDELKQRTTATLIGQPTGAGPNHYGDAQLMTLPNSGIFFFLSTRQWTGIGKNDSLKTMKPDILVRYNFEDYLEGTDPWTTAMKSFSDEEKRNP